MLAQPRPAFVIVRGPNPHEITTDGSASWASVAETIDSLAPESLEALTSDRKLLRAVRVDQIDDDAGAGAAEPTAPSYAVDAETRRFELFAAHLSKAYEHATGVAFERLAGLFDATARRTEALERALARHVEIQIQQAQEQTADPLTSLAGAFLSGSAAGQSALPSTTTTTNGKPNGGH